MLTAAEWLVIIRSQDSDKLFAKIRAGNLANFYKDKELFLADGSRINRRNNFIRYFKETEAKVTRDDYLLLQDMIDELEVQKQIKNADKNELENVIRELEFLQDIILDALDIKHDKTIIDEELVSKIFERYENEQSTALPMLEDIRLVLNTYEAHLQDEFQKNKVQRAIENNYYKLPTQKPEKISENVWENANVLSKKINKVVELKEIINQADSQNPPIDRLRLFKHKFNEDETQAILKEPRQTFGRKLLDQINGILEKVTLSITFKTKGEKRSAEIRDILEEQPGAKKMRH